MLLNDEYVIAIANLKDNKIFNVSYHKGTKKECISFINENYFKYLIDSGLRKDEVVINLAYTLDSTDHLDEWFTKDELIEQGVFTL